jgi:nitrite reductase/ring-hydroxylating ferredoxin subunit
VTEIRVERAALLAEGKSQSFKIPQADSEKSAFVLRFDGEFVAFLNECPHWTIELDLGDEHFFDEEIGRIYCKNHGALFHPSDGKCETGPCLGRSLTRLTSRVVGEDIVVTL